MSSFVTLQIVKDMRLLNYDKRLKASRELTAMISKYGLTFRDKPYLPAVQAISKHPLVDRVVVTHVTETNIGTWRNGRKS